MKVKKKTIQNLSEAEAAMETVGVSKDVKETMAEKAIFQVLEIEEVSSPAANVIKQVAISRGSDAVVHRKVSRAGLRRAQSRRLKSANSLNYCWKRRGFLWMKRKTAKWTLKKPLPASLTLFSWTYKCALS